MKKLLLLFLTILVSFSAKAQVDSVASSFEGVVFETVEERIAEVEESADLSDDLESLLQWQGKRVNLNELSAEVAYVLLKLSDYQYYQLQLYIETYGELVTIYELAAVEGFSREDVERLMNCVEVRPSRRARGRFADFFRKSQSTLLFRYGQVLEKQAGYRNDAANGYLGSPQQLTFKYSFQSGEHFSMALAGEKDAGEEFFKGSQKQGFDHYSFFLNVKNIGVLKSCVIGDYMVSFGQGLVMGGRMMGSRGGGAAQVRRFPSLLRGTASMNESRNFRGVAAVIGNAQYVGTIFYGHRFYDAKIAVDSCGDEFLNGNLTTTGYHRTDSEIAAKNTVRDRTYGAHFQLKRRIFEIGVTAVRTQYLRNLPPSDERVDVYCGSPVVNLGTDYKVILRQTVLFGEIGVSVVEKTPAFAILQGGLFKPDPRSTLSAVFRYYDRSYEAPNASAFGAGSSCSNEWGLYVAADYVTGRRSSLSLFADFYRFPWLRYKADKPSGGFDIGAKFNVSLTKNLTASFKYQYSMIEQNYRLTDYYQSVPTIQKHRFRCVVSATPISWLTLKTHAETVVNSISESQILRNGFLLFQDVAFKFEKWNLGLTGRFALFQMDSYDERIYAYENDLYQTFTINSYYGKGVRYYIVVSYGYAFFDLQLKFSQTYYDDRSVISSGLSQIDGRTKSELRLQMLFHF